MAYVMRTINPLAGRMAVSLYRVAFRLFYGRRVQSWSWVSRAHRLASRMAGQGSDTLTVDFHGSLVSVPAADRSMALALVSGNYERLVVASVQALVEPGSAFLDVGANIGLYSTLASRLAGQSGSVVSVEPVAETREWLNRNLTQNGCSNVDVFGVAAGESDGVLRLGRIAGELGTSSAHEIGDSFEDVEVRRLDDLLPGRSFSLIKMDVEGHELAALRGMPRILTTGDPVLILEYSNNTYAAELREFLRRHFPYLWLVDERRHRIVPVEARDLVPLRRANVVASRRLLRLPR